MHKEFHIEQDIQIQKDKNSLTDCMTTDFCHVTYVFQSESTHYSCLNVKELLALSRRKI